MSLDPLAQAVVVTAAAALIGWLVWVAYCVWLVIYTKDSNSLTHAGDAARGFWRRSKD